MAVTFEITEYYCFVCEKWHKRHSKPGERHWEESEKKRGIGLLRWGKNDTSTTTQGK